jgi:hypothetical protein
MKRLLLGALALVVVATTAAPIGVVTSILRLNASDTDPWAAVVGAPFVGEKDLYLWFINYSPNRVTFSLGGTLEVVSVEPQPEWSNTGTLASPRLERSGCDSAYETLLARVRVRDNTGSGGRLCFAESALDSVLCFDECWGEYYVVYEAYGYRTDGGSECPYVFSSECMTLATDAATWGLLKSNYR